MYQAPVKSEFLLQGKSSISVGGEVEASNILSQVGVCSESNSLAKEDVPRSRLRGQNKSRPGDKRAATATRLCPSKIRGVDCERGKDCYFMHDVAEYWANKEPDIGPHCYNFENRGWCNFGVSCRFAKQHIDHATLKNLENESSLNVKRETHGHEYNSDERNYLSRELQIKLRKQSYSYHAYDEYMRIKGVISSKASSLKGNAELPTTIDAAIEVTGEHDHGFHVDVPPSVRESNAKTIDFAGKLYLAPLTTVGNLPFRRICVDFGAEITCSEMAMATCLLQGQQTEWALLKRHASEKIFGVQLCGNYVDSMGKCSQLLSENVDCDFIDLNLGCPIDLVCKKGAGCMLMRRSRLTSDIVDVIEYCTSKRVPIPITLKMRTGIQIGKNIADSFISSMHADSRGNKTALYTLHGRSREQRYTKKPDWTYIDHCASVADPIPLFGCGDVLSFEEYFEHIENSRVAGVIIARGALIKPWIFTEIKERRHWDISAGERLDILRKFVNFGLEHWGSDTIGVDRTRRFLLEWLSFLYRYIPVGLLERLPQKINERPPKFFGRNDLETQMASTNCKDWISITEMLLGPVAENFQFLPKHKANSYE